MSMKRTNEDDKMLYEFFQKTRPTSMRKTFVVKEGAYDGDEKRSPSPGNGGMAASAPMGIGEAGPLGPGGKLRPEQEKLVRDFAMKIFHALEEEEIIPKHTGVMTGTDDAGVAADFIEPLLQELLVASEKAEGEDPQHEEA